MDTLIKLLQELTPHGEEYKLYPFISRAAKRAGATLEIDEEGNVIVDLYPTNTAFVAHLDDVSFGGFSVFRNGKYEVEKKPKGPRRIFVNQNGLVCANRDILGADDKAGVWVLLKLLEQRVHGRYLFTVGEECGGIGAQYMMNSGVLDDIEIAVEFDRRGVTDLITSCSFDYKMCSTAFTQFMANGLNLEPERGLFTDVHIFAERVAECVNVSVGYEQQHTEYEYLDSWWLQRVLLPRVLRLDWENAPVERLPQPKPVHYLSHGGKKVEYLREDGTYYSQGDEWKSQEGGADDLGPDPFGHQHGIGSTEYWKEEYWEDCDSCKKDYNCYECEKYQGVMGGNT